MNLFSLRGDPHSVYYRIAPRLSLPKDIEIVRRGYMNYTSNFFLVRILIILFGDFLACRTLRLNEQSGKKSLLIEFSSLTFFLFYVIPKRFKVCPNVYLNINHNLNNKMEASFWLPLLAKFVTVIFIEAPAHLERQFPFVRSIKIKPEKKQTATKKIVVFTGNRVEQVDYKWLSVLRDLKISWPDKVQVYGALGDGYINDDQFGELFSAESILVILYHGANYNIRHSGIVLEAIANGVPLVMEQSMLVDHYQHRGFSVYSFNGGCQLMSLLKNTLGKV